MKAMMSGRDERPSYWNGKLACEDEARVILEETEPQQRIYKLNAAGHWPVETRRALAESLAAFVEMNEATAFGS